MDRVDPMHMLSNTAHADPIRALPLKDSEAAMCMQPNTATEDAIRAKLRIANEEPS